MSYPQEMEQANKMIDDVRLELRSIDNLVMAKPEMLICLYLIPIMGVDHCVLRKEKNRLSFDYFFLIHACRKRRS
jgi:hypothetical protein